MTLFTLTESLALIGTAHWMANDREQAMEAWERGLAASLPTPVQQAIRMRLAQAYRGAGRQREAIRMLELVLALDPKHAEARVLLKELRAQ